MQAQGHTDMFTWAQRDRDMCINTDTPRLLHPPRPVTCAQTPQHIQTHCNTLIPAPPRVSPHEHPQAEGHTHSEIPQHAHSYLRKPQHARPPPPPLSQCVTHTEPHTVSHRVTHTVSHKCKCHTRGFSHAQCHTRTQCHTHAPPAASPVPTRLSRPSRLSLRAVTARPDPAGSPRAQANRA